MTHFPHKVPPHFLPPFNAKLTKTASHTGYLNPSLLRVTWFPARHHRCGPRRQEPGLSLGAPLSREAGRFSEKQSLHFLALLHYLKSLQRWLTKRLVLAALEDFCNCHWPAFVLSFQHVVGDVRFVFDLALCTAAGKKRNKGEGSKRGWASALRITKESNMLLPSWAWGVGCQPRHWGQGSRRGRDGELVELAFSKPTHSHYKEATQNHRRGETEVAKWFSRSKRGKN